MEDKRIEYSFKDFLKDKSPYFTLFFVSPHWVGISICLIIGFLLRFLVGLLLACVVIYVMYLIRRNRILKT